MLRWLRLAMAAAALLLSSSADACSCRPGTPPPLSDCAVSSGQAALLVTFKCVKTIIVDINTGNAVADVVINKIFKDSSGLDLQVGDTVTVRSRTQEATCGVGLDFAQGAQWILFAFLPSGSRPPFVLNDDVPASAVNRRLQQTVTGSDGVFSDVGEAVDGSVCDVSDVDLETALCSGNIIKPTATQITQLMQGCG